MDDPQAWLEYEGAKWYEFDGVLFDAQVEVTAPLYTFGKIGSLRKMGEVGTKAAREGRSMLVGQIVHEVKRAYYTLQFLEKMISVLEDGKSYVESAETKLSELLADGSENVTEIDRYKFSVVKADVDTRIEEARRARGVVVDALRMLMDLPPDAPIYLDTRYLPDYKPVDAFKSREYVQQTMAQYKPDLRFYDRETELAELQVKQQRAYYFPDFFLTLKYEYMVSPNVPEYDNPYLNSAYNKHYVIGFLGLSYTFDLPLQMARVKQAEARLKKTRYANTAKRDKLRFELDQAWREYLEKIQQVSINLSGKTAGHKWMITALMNYNIGLLESSSMVEAIAAYFKTQFNYFSAVYQANLAEVKLEHMMGLQTAGIDMKAMRSAEPIADDSSEVDPGTEALAPAEFSKE
jgi:outer membrane protein TolC